jgi:alkylhydroperoxidase/carboxymuconolactone decarboxylase family protein YurZ
LCDRSSNAPRIPLACRSYAATSAAPIVTRYGDPHGRTDQRYRDITRSVSEFAVSSAAIPDTTRGSRRWRKVLCDGAPDKKTELIALALGVVRTATPHGFHVEALVKLGASRAESRETLGWLPTWGGLSLMYAADVIAAWEEFTEPVPAAAD